MGKLFFFYRLKIKICYQVKRKLNFREENSLKQFVLDLHSGKLHREFHNGPDPTEAPKVRNYQIKDMDKFNSKTNFRFKSNK